MRTELLPHQKRAVEKLRKIKVGALYMEQGTGKTRTALEIIKIRMKKERVNHIIWLCPCSVKENLKIDIEKHLGFFPKEITICGIETLSTSIKVNSELSLLAKTKQCYLVVDESSLVKNFMAKRTKNIIELSKKCTYKMILNGTPVSRNEADLFSQWYILDWRILGYKSYWSFAANHLEYDENVPGKIIRCLNIDYLSRKIAPYTYQILKSECLELPSKTYETVYCSMSEEQEVEYMRVSEHFLMKMDEMQPQTIYRLFTALQDVISGKYVYEKEKHIVTSDIFKEPLENPRIQMLLYMLDNIYDKVIIFCKYSWEIENVIEVLEARYGKSTVRYDGRVSLKKRNENIMQFETSARFLVANKKCAGYGLNLQCCSFVIFYSNDWDYNTRIQAEDRVHRIGQKHNVHIVDICCNYSLDVKILDCLYRKENMLESFRRDLNSMKDEEMNRTYGFRCLLKRDDLKEE